MTGQPQTWETYEQVAVHIMNQIAKHLGLERVEGKQHVYGSRSGTDWEIDGKGVKIGDEGFIIIECRRYPRAGRSSRRLRPWRTASWTPGRLVAYWSAHWASKRVPRRSRRPKKFKSCSWGQRAPLLTTW